MLKVEVEREDDGRWLAEVVDLPGVLAYGTDSTRGRRASTSIVVAVLADRLEHGEAVPQMGDVFAVLP